MGAAVIRSRLRRVSAKRARQRIDRQAVCELVRERDRTCRAEHLVEVPCGGPLDVHELVPRSAWPAGYLVVENCILLCRQSHSFCHDNPRLARELGLLKSSWERP